MSINPEIVAWARETSGLEIAEAASKLGLHDTKTSTAIEKLWQYESGEKSPSRSLLLKMSTIYKRPLLTFYLKNTPVVKKRGEDFRVLSNDIPARVSAIIDALLRSIKARQSLVRETLVQEDEADTLDFIGELKLDTKLKTASDFVIKTLQFERSEYREQPGIEHAFTYLREKVESLGIYVVLESNLGSYHTDIPVEFFRGFVLSDDIAPFIVINNKDSKAAWCFTLIHELVHLFLGVTGISAGTYSEQKVEKFCNDVAAQVLLPGKELKAAFQNIKNMDELKELISLYAEERNISSSMVVYGLFKRGLISKETWTELSTYYKELWRRQKELKKEKNKEQGGGPNPYIVKRYNLGKALVGFVSRMNQSGALTNTKAATIMGVKALKVGKYLGMEQRAA